MALNSYVGSCSYCFKMKPDKFTVTAVETLAQWNIKTRIPFRFDL